MGKHGPCYHCGVTSTPLWRNGPPEKPVLCNACGSRWRTKGTLTNYTPLHSRAEPDDFVDHRISKVKTISIKNKEAKVLKRKINNDIPEYGIVPLDYNSGLRKRFDEDTSNRSSSGSVISNSESNAQYGSADANDFTGPPQPIVWDSTVPSKKRTCVTRTKPSSFEKLTKDLYTIWHEQQSSCLSGSSEEDLLLETDKPMVSVEFGHGSVLIRHPSSIARDEESEASSLSVDQKPVTFPWIEKMKKATNHGTEQERLWRDKDEHEKMQILTHHNSPLCYIDLQDVLNFEKFASSLTSDEQDQLLKFLPSVDTMKDPESLKSMFDSPQFKENLLSFQKLLANGVFDNSFSRVSTDDCRILKKLLLCNFTKSKWVEQYKIFKDLKGKSRIDDSEVVRGFNGLATDHMSSMKGSQDGEHQQFAGTKVIMKSPRRIIGKSSYDDKELKEKNESFFGEKSQLFSWQNDNNSIMLGSSHFDEESCEQDLLVDVPYNSSFPQAELLVVEASTSSSSVYPNIVRP
ncbi:hypothetical protein ACJIZ3_009715 [Penstemon smallii]|uniref:GATA transcription factor n=1 Tax=Penstemon smallii TaxID=265156 RepID=A0ABD3TDB3_9LAMI